MTKKYHFSKMVLFGHFLAEISYCDQKNGQKVSSPPGGQPPPNDPFWSKMTIFDQKPQYQAFRKPDAVGA